MTDIEQPRPPPSIRDGSFAPPGDSVPERTRTDLTPTDPARVPIDPDDRNPRMPFIPTHWLEGQVRPAPPDAPQVSVDPIPQEIATLAIRTFEGSPGCFSRAKRKCISFRTQCISFLTQKLIGRVILALLIQLLVIIFRKFAGPYWTTFTGKASEIADWIEVPLLQMYETVFLCLTFAFFGKKSVRAFVQTCTKAFNDPRTRLLGKEDLTKLLEDMGIDPTLWVNDQSENVTFLSQMIFGAFGIAISAVSNKGEAMTNSALSAMIYEKLRCAMSEETRGEAIGARTQLRIKRIFTALENTSYAVARDYNCSPCDQKDLIFHIFNEPIYHMTFAFYYKHPIFDPENYDRTTSRGQQRPFRPGFFLLSLSIAHISLYVYLAFLSFRGRAAEVMHISTQARLIRHAVHRHVLMPWIMTAFMMYFSWSWITGNGFFDDSLRNEGNLALVVFVIGCCFGGLGNFS